MFASASVNCSQAIQRHFIMSSFRYAVVDVDIAGDRFKGIEVGVIVLAVTHSGGHILALGEGAAGTARISS